MTKMTSEEAFVKVLQMHGIENAFGIIGSAFMPISDLFPKAGITFWDVAHESNGGLIADGYTRSTGKIAMCIAQNGPGVTGLVTPIKTAYWNHTPMLLVTPQAANKTMGQGGFQEVEQMNLFKDMVCYQEEVRDPSRMAEVLNRVIEKSIRGSAPAQINVPRDYWTQVIDIELPPIVRLERSAGGATAVTEAAKLLSSAKFPVILSGAGVVIGNAIEDCKKIAEKLDAPVCSGYQHNDSFPGNHPLAVGPLGYNGSKAAMELISKADVVLALGTRLNPFSTLPGYGIDYWPKKASIIQVDINSDRIGLTKKVTVGICGDAKLVSQQILAKLSSKAGDTDREKRKALIHQTKSAWLQMLSSLDHEEDDPGTVWNKEARERDKDRMSPRMAWKAIQAGLPEDVIISSDIGNNCAIGNAYPTFEKAFGNLQKIGKKVKYINVLEPAEEPKNGGGLYFMDTSSAAAECVTLQAAAGFTVHLFPTGQGNIIGNPIEPVIKLTANPKTASTMSEHIDLDVSKILQREMNLSEAGDALIDTTVKTANGRITCAEALGHKEFVITKLYRSA